jgi:spermidine synthase
MRVTKSGKAEPAELSTGLRRFLYLTIFSTGAAILIVEILGAKMLSPFFGTSHFVWTAQIAVTLVSLSIGYWVGGTMVDRSTELRNLYHCILGAGVYLALTIPFCAKVCYACLKLPLSIGSLFASLFLFFVPLTLLAVTGPFVIRVFTSSVDSVGGNVGRLSAISTIGSVIGTVLIGYVLIPLLPNSATMLIVAGLLCVLALAYLFLGKAGSGNNTVAVVACIIAALLGWRGVQLDGRTGSDYMVEIERTNSNFGLMQVFETKDGTRRYYINDYLTQNTYDPETGQSTSLFTHMLHGLAKVYTRETKDVLCIGMGVGIVPMLFAKEDSSVDVVEINDKIAGLAQRHFGLEPDRLNLTVGDGRHYVNSSEKQYDAVILDAFLGDSSPSHLMSQEAFAQMKRVLEPDGVLVINCFGDFEAGKDYFTGSLDKTLKSVFATVRIHASGNGNVFFVATAAPELTQHRPLDVAKAHMTMADEMEYCLEAVETVNPESGIVLTDDYNPVEFHDAANREELRRDLAMSMRAG